MYIGHDLNQLPAFLGVSCRWRNGIDKGTTPFFHSPTCMINDPRMRAAHIVQQCQQLTWSQPISGGVRVYKGTGAEMLGL